MKGKIFMTNKKISSLTNLRMLALDMIQKANSGHPGIVLDAAPMIYVLYRNHLVSNPKEPEWPNRDRFVLSAGHGSALLYAALHMFGFNLKLSDLKKFRQLNSKTPGHPEYGIVPGVDATTGPLGQGLAMAVGMAISEKHASDLVNTDSIKVIDHYTYVLCGDGDLMEGISHEAASLAGFLKLNKLIVLYDSNHVSLDGDLDRESIDNVEKRFVSYGWNYITANGNDIDDINRSIIMAKKSTDKPSIIECNTTIGVGAPKAGTHLVHGSALSEEDYNATRAFYKWNMPPFYCDSKNVASLSKIMKDRFAKRKVRTDTEIEKLKKYDTQNLLRLKQLAKPQFDFIDRMPRYNTNTKVSGRDAIKQCIEYTESKCINVLGGSADVAASTKAYNSKSGNFNSNCGEANNLVYGVREFASAAIANGIMLSGTFKCYTSTFLAFSDYMKPAIRLAAIQKIPSIFVFTHDSIAVGEDGPTHQPIEQIMGLREIPNVNVIRPTDSNEVISAWKEALESKFTPTILVLSRQPIPVITRGNCLKYGGYVIGKIKKESSGVLIGTGSEVQVLMQAQKKLLEKNLQVSVVAIPSFTNFDHQSINYRNTVLPNKIQKRLSLEAGTTLGWEKYVGLKGITLGVNEFGKSGTPEDIQKFYEISSNAVVNKYLNHFEYIK